MNSEKVSQEKLVLFDNLSNWLMWTLKMCVVLFDSNYLCIFIFNCECCPSCFKASYTG